MLLQTAAELLCAVVPYHERSGHQCPGQAYLCSGRQLSADGSGSSAPSYVAS